MLKRLMTTFFAVIMAIGVNATLRQVANPVKAQNAEDILMLSEELQGLMREYPGVQMGAGAATRRLFERIYKVRVRRIVRTRDGMLSGDNDYIRTLSTILRSWTSLRLNSQEPFVIALTTAESFNTAWEVLPIQHKSRIDALMQANNIKLSDGLDDEELKSFYINRKDVDKIYEAMIDIEIQELKRIMSRKLEDTILFWNVFLKGADIDNAEVYIAQIATFKIKSHSIVREVANDGKSTIYIPPENAYRPLALEKALVHEMGALWGFEHSLNQDVEQFFERWLNEGKPRKVNVPGEIKLAVTNQLGKASADRHF